MQTIEKNEFDEDVRVTTTPGGAVIRELVGEPPAPSRLISQTEFLRRLTNSELEAILAAAKASVAVEAWVYRFDRAGDVDLNDPLTVQGVQSLEVAGLLAAGRASQVLGG